MAEVIPSNLLTPLPGPREDGNEDFVDLWTRPGVRVERIVSHGQVSPEDFFYEQTEDEWVLVLQGRAVLQLEAPEEILTLEPGDHLMIPAGRRHRVQFTASPTVWLAVWVDA